MELIIWLAQILHWLMAEGLGLGTINAVLSSAISKHFPIIIQ
jgi:hypothetical protein